MKRDAILSIKLPAEGGRLEDYSVREPREFKRPSRPFTRHALAAAHVVADPLSSREPWLEAAIDWDATIAYRRHLWDWGFGVAEAMDTAQRGMGLDWAASLELIRVAVPSAATTSSAATNRDRGSPSRPRTSSSVMPRRSDDQLFAYGAEHAARVISTRATMSTLIMGSSLPTVAF